jgi:hypothetical protein
MVLFESFAFLILTLLPGLLLGLNFGSSRQIFLISLPLGCGLIYALSNYTSTLGLPFGGSLYFAVIAVLLVCVVKNRKEMRWLRKDITATEMIGIISALFVALILFVMWWRAAGSFGQLLPNHDAMYHSYVIRNILETQSTKVGEALRLFPLGAGSAADFYPLGLHSVIALSSRITGTSINGSMNLVTLVLAVGMFPISMWIWTREFLGNSKIVAAIAPVAVLMLSSVFPWSPMSWGGMPTIVAMCITPAAAVFVADVLTAPTPKGIFLVTVAMVGLFSMHTPELVLLFAMIVVLLIRRGNVSSRNLFSCALQVGIGSVIALAPVVLATVGGASERSLDYQPVLESASTIGQSLLFSFSGFELPVATFLVVVGIIHSNREKNSVLTCAFLTVVLLTAVAGVLPNNPLVRLITKPWYGQVLRLDYNIVYFAVPLMACAITWFLSDKKTSLLRFVSLGTVVALLFVGLTQVQRADKLLLASWYNGLVPVNQNSVAAFHWMAKNIGTDEYVLTDYDGIDGSTWMYALAGVRPVMYGAIASDSRDIFRNQKIDVLANIGKLESRPELMEFLYLKKIRYFYFDERTNAISPNHSFKLETLFSESKFKRVFVLGNAHVFEINSPGT